MIKLQQLRFSYPGLPFFYFDLHLEKGTRTALTGISGSGKSTLLHLIAGFNLPYSGEIWLDGKQHTNTKPHQRPVSMLFQDNNLFNHLTVANNIGLGIKPSLKRTEQQQHDLERIAKEMGLTAHLDKLPDQLSGGQKQRVALARCLLRNQPILLLDEPFSALDTALRQEMLSLIIDISLVKQLTLVLITHQPEEITHCIDKIITVKQDQQLEITEITHHP